MECLPKSFMLNSLGLGLSKVLSQVTGSHNFLSVAESELGIRHLCLELDMGRRDYDESLEIQTKIVLRRKENVFPDCLLFFEYPHIFTLGQVGKKEHLLVSSSELKRLGISVYQTGRGGDITYHGPGQLVTYPILDLKTWYKDVGLYLRTLEKVIIETLFDFGIEGEREPGMTGVWVKGFKIAAIGIKTSQWVTSHGLALNVNTDLKYFNFIVPCGLFSRGVTSMEKILGKSLKIKEVKDSLSFHFTDNFKRDRWLGEWDTVESLYAAK